MSFARIFRFSTEFDNQANLKKALDEVTVDAIVVYYCGSEFNQDEYYAARSIRFPQHTFGVGAFWNVDGEKWPIYDNEYDGDLFQCLKNATRGKRWIPRSKETPCHQTFTGAQRKGVIHKDAWMYVVIGSAALLVFILGVGAIYSWQFQRAKANVRGKAPGGSEIRQTNTSKGSPGHTFIFSCLLLFPNARTCAVISNFPLTVFRKQKTQIMNGLPKRFALFTLSCFSFPTQ